MTRRCSNSKAGKRQAVCPGVPTFAATLAAALAITKAARPRYRAQALPQAFGSDEVVTRLRIGETG